MTSLTTYSITPWIQWYTIHKVVYSTSTTPQLTAYPSLSPHILPAPPTPVSYHIISYRTTEVPCTVQRTITSQSLLSSSSCIPIFLFFHKTPYTYSTYNNTWHRIVIVLVPIHPSHHLSITYCGTGAYLRYCYWSTGRSEWATSYARSSILHHGIHGMGKARKAKRDGMPRCV